MRFVEKVCVKAYVLWSANNDLTHVCCAKTMFIQLCCPKESKEHIQHNQTCSFMYAAPWLKVLCECCAQKQLYTYMYTYGARTECDHSSVLPAEIVFPSILTTKKRILTQRAHEACGRQMYLFATNVFTRSSPPKRKIRAVFCATNIFMHAWCARTECSRMYVAPSRMYAVRKTRIHELCCAQTSYATMNVLWQKGNQPRMLRAAKAFTHVCCLGFRL